MRCAPAIVIASSILCAATARADDEPPAARLFGEGLALLDANKPAEACAAFAKSLELDASAAGTMLNLGICHEQLGKLATAIKWYRRAEARSAQLKRTETEHEAKSKAAAIAGRVATIAVKVKLTNAPAGAAVRLDGETLDTSTLGRIEVDAGVHVLALEVSPRIEQKVDVADGAHLDVELAVPRPPVVRYTVDDPGRAERRRAILIGGAGLGAVGASVAFGLIGRSAHDAENTQPHRGNWVTAVRWIGTPVAVAGIAAMSYAAVRYLRAPGKHRREVPQLAPAIAQGQAGFVFATQF